VRRIVASSGCAAASSQRSTSGLRFMARRSRSSA
jgi:hypothetical protein